MRFDDGSLLMAVRDDSELKRHFNFVRNIAGIGWVVHDPHIGARLFVDFRFHRNNLRGIWETVFGELSPRYELRGLTHRE